ncbi:hypothetical protein HGRIS_008804 [Hohenbuehelia grisea]|uniref:Ser-Thr-rich glycosyl-phosphatidyl-inositol-anchored membrane family-domain-containing protein n=1 Tax=Hohenbuehelia grisea TaxID=104357 RepID=A0ABR3J968_9AGAR
MFAKLSLLLLSTAALVAPLSISTPRPAGGTGRSNRTPRAASRVIVEWQNTAQEFNSIPFFSVFLTNPRFNDDFALANNVNMQSSAGGSIEVVLPAVELDVRDNYSIKFTNIGNKTDVYGQSSTFSLDTSPESTTSSSTSSSSGASVPSSGSLSSAAIITPSPISGSGFGSTVSVSSAPTLNTVTGPPASVTSSAGNSASTGAAFNGAQRLSGDLSGSALVAMAAAAVAGVVAVMA